MNEAAAQTETNPKIFLKTVEVEVSDEENTLRLVRLAEVDGNINTTEADKASRVSDFNSDLKQLRKERNKLLEAITTRREKREIECYQVPDERRGIMATIRKSDGKVIDERALTIEERQTPLPFRGKTPEEQAADAANDGEQAEDAEIQAQSDATAAGKPKKEKPIKASAARAAKAAKEKGGK